MAMQDIKQELSRKFKDLKLQKENEKFFKSCISEGLIPRGFQGNFNLAMDVNDENFVNETQKLLNEKASRLLDLVYRQTCDNVTNLKEHVEELQDAAVDAFGQDAANRMFLVIKHECYSTIDQKSRKLSKKLKNLRLEHMNIQNMLRHNDGSRKLVGQEYIKNNDNGENKRAPFPENLRPSRRNRPHRRNGCQNNNQEYVVTWIN
jgi:hypothetical protein